jgi:hypothetical protein
MRFFYIFIILNFLSAFSFAQTDSTKKTEDGRKPFEKKPNNIDWRDRFYWGGNVGASFGSITFVDLSPLVGVRVTKQFSIGLGAIYNYYSYNYAGVKYSTNLYGSRIYARVFPFTNKNDNGRAFGGDFLSNVYLQAGWDHINRDDPYSLDPGSRVWVENLLVGGGIRYPVTDRIYCVATGLWNLNQTPLSPYYNPIIQIGFIGTFR